MPNILEYLRQKNIFGQPPIYGNDLPSQGGITGNMQFPDGPVELDTTGLYGGGNPQNPYENVDFGSTDFTTPSLGMAPAYDVEGRMKELYQPESNAGDAFTELINQYPQREKPSKLRSLGAMIVDYTKGPARGQQFYNEPFTDKLLDWKNKVGPVQQAANLERQQNINDRTLAYQTVSAELRDKAQAAKERKDEAQMKIAQQRADLYQFKAEHPDWKIITPKGGNVYAINPQNPNERLDLGIPTGSLTETDKIHATHTAKMEEIGAGGAQARETEQTRQTGREAIAETRGWGDPVMIKDKTGKEVAVSINKITGEVKEVKLNDENIGPVAKGGVGGTKGEQPSQTKVRQYNTARELANSRPDLAPFIKLTSANEFTITPQSTNSGLTSYFKGPTSGPTPAQFKEINDRIYGTAPVASHSSTTTAPKAPVGWKYVPKPGGGWTAVEDNKGGEF